MANETLVTDLTTLPDQGIVMFAVRRFADDVQVAVHRASLASSADPDTEIAAINAMAPDFPAIGADDAAAIRQAFADCPVVITEPTLEDLKAAKRAAIDNQYTAQSQAPFEWDFGSIPALDDNGVSVGAAGVQSLQVRGITDEKNWLAAHAGALTAVLGGAPATVCPIKTTANVWVQVTALDLITVLAAGEPGARRSLLQRQQACLENYGALKKACDEAIDQDALDAIDEAAGWPA